MKKLQEKITEQISKMKQEAREIRNETNAERNKLAMMFSQMAMNRLQVKGADAGKDYRTQWQNVIFAGQLGRA